MNRPPRPEWRRSVYFAQLGAAAPLPLDSISARGAYCLSHKIRTAHDGPLVRLIRADADQRDFFANASGSLDVAEILMWSGALTAKVHTWYDQSGNGLDLNQTTDANRLIVVPTPGSLSMSGGQPACSGGASLFVERAAAFISPSAFSFVCIYQPDSVASSNTSYQQTTGLYGEAGTYYGASLQTTGVYAGFFGTTVRNVMDGVSHSGIQIMRHSYDGALQRLQCNDRPEVASAVAETCTPTTETLRVGAGASGGYSGQISLFIVRNTALTASEAAPIYQWASKAYSGLVTPVT